jgi:lysozyme
VVDKVALRKELVRDESVENKVYRCSAGKLTIGIGRNLEDVGLSDEEIQFLFENDVARAEGELDRALPWWRGMSEVRQRVLMNMIFNLGLPRLLGFRKALAHMEARRYSDAAREMLDSKWRRDVKDRAYRLADAMITG